MKHLFTAIFTILFFATSNAQSTSNTIILKDIEWDKNSPASQIELQIPSEKSLLQGFMYKANGAAKHPTLLLLHGFPGNERNLDLAQVVRSKGWNVIYFNYRGSWGSEGNFSFANCVQDVVNVVSFCKKFTDSLQIDTSNIVLFGHSMGGWVCLKALEQLPSIKKGFALSAWNIGEDFTGLKSEKDFEERIKAADEYFVLNTSPKEIFAPVYKNPATYNLINDGAALANKQIIMLDEHNLNMGAANAIQKENKAYFDYEVWQTDHPFTNKRISLINKVLDFLAR